MSEHKFMIFNNITSHKVSDNPADGKEISAKDVVNLIKNDPIVKSRHDFYLSVLETNPIKSVKQASKKGLKNVTWACTIKDSRSEANLKDFSGLMCFDIDHLPKEKLDFYKNKLCEDPYTFICFKGPSQDGFKLIVKIPQLQNLGNKEDNKAQYEFYYNGYREYMSDIEFDNTSDVSRACYLPHDEDIYFNEDSKVFDKGETGKGFPKPTPKPQNQTLTGIKTTSQETTSQETKKKKKKISESPLTLFVKTKTDLKKYLEYKGVKIEVGKLCKCPLGHDSSSDANFSINVKNGEYLGNCFHSDHNGTCDLGGDLLAITKHLEGVDQYAALYYLITNFKIKVPKAILAAEVSYIFKYLKTPTDSASKLFFIHFEQAYHMKVRPDTIATKQTEIYYYDEGVYKPNGKSFISQIVKEVAGIHYSEKLLRECIAKIEAIFNNPNDDWNDFINNTPETLIPVANGILNLKEKDKSKALLPFSPDHVFFTKCKCVYDPKAKVTPFMLDHFDKITCGKKNLIKKLQELGGLILHNRNFAQKGFFFTGNGNNGKDITLNLLSRHLLGDDSSSFIPLENFIDGDSSLPALIKSRVNVCGETSKNRIKCTQMIKKILGESTISIKQKYKSDVILLNKATCIFAANKMPEFYDDSDGFYRRWEEVPFKAKFVEKTLYEKAPEDQKDKTIFLKDREMDKKLSTPKEISGLLNWFIEGLHGVYNNNMHMTTETSAEENRKKMQIAAASFRCFLDEEYCTTEKAYSDKWVKDENCTLFSEVKTGYEKYCNTHDIPPESLKHITATLEKYKKQVSKKRNKLHFTDGELLLNKATIVQNLIKNKFDETGLWEESFINSRIWDKEFEKETQAIKSDEILVSEILKQLENNPKKKEYLLKNNLIKENISISGEVVLFKV